MLGSLEVATGDGWTSIGSAKRRSLLAALLIRAGEVVRVEQLLGELWGDAPPSTAITQVHGHVMNLRRVLADHDGTTLVTEGHGYRLAIEAADVDAGVFESLAEPGLAALAKGDADTAAALLRAALELWRGEALSDVAPTQLVRTATARLTERWLAVWEARMDAELARGQHASLVAELQQNVEMHPLRERPWRQLMLALHRAGRQAEALQTFQRVRRTWLAEIGVEPGPALRQLHQELLTRPAIRVAPRQLPVSPGFVGRAAELARIGRGTTAIVGGAGVGKTALAVHWATSAADRFPDGQLYVDLRGFSPDPVVPAEVALASFLQALGEPVPAEADERAARYRTTLAERRMLVVLDNARDPDHVRPLLPGPSPSEVLITSRDDLRGLVATHAVRRLRLEPLPAADAAELLATVLGPGDFAELAELCDRLPLALRVAAANLSARPQQTVADLVAVLRQGDRLAELSVPGDPRVGVRAALDLSYRSLPPSARRLFRVLERQGTVRSAARAAGMTTQEAAAALELLAAVHLVTLRAPHHYAMAGLVHEYAGNPW